jgi:hypothetical protein
MCDPISASIGTALVGGKTAATAAGLTAFQLGMIGASTTLGLATPVVSAIGQRQQAKQQIEFQKKSQQAAVKKQQLQQTAANLELDQRRKAIAQQSEQLAKTFEMAESTQRARGAVAQSSAISNELKRQLGTQSQRLQEQLGLYELQHSLGVQQMGLAGEQELLSLSQPVQTQSPLVTTLSALSGGLQGMGAGMQFAQYTRPRKNVTIKTG